VARALAAEMHGGATPELAVQQFQRPIASVKIACGPGAKELGDLVPRISHNGFVWADSAVRDSSRQAELAELAKLAQDAGGNGGPYARSPVDVIIHPRMALPSGTRFGPYEIVAPADTGWRGEALSP
jgi:hypothetical protein